MTPASPIAMAKEDEDKPEGGGKKERGEEGEAGDKKEEGEEGEAGDKEEKGEEGEEPTRPNYEVGYKKEPTAV